MRDVPNGKRRIAALLGARKPRHAAGAHARAGGFAARGHARAVALVGVGVVACVVVAMSAGGALAVRGAASHSAEQLGGAAAVDAAAELASSGLTDVEYVSFRDVRDSPGLVALSPSEFDAVPQSDQVELFSLGKDDAAMGIGSQAADSVDGGASGDGVSAAPEVDSASVAVEVEVADSAGAASETASTEAAGSGALPCAELSEEALADVSAALAPFREDGRAVGFVLLNANTGKGVALNAGEAVYGASSFKLPYVSYVGECLIDGGQLSLDSPCPRGELIDGLSEFANDYAAEYPVSQLMEAAVVRSSNDAYGFLRDAYDAGCGSYEGGIEAYLAESGVDPALKDDTDFPTYSALDATKLWYRALMWFEGGSETAQYVSDLSARTETSFIRSALGEGVAVRDKGGWCTGDPWDWQDFNGLCDSGIVEDDGNAYLLCVMTGMPGAEENFSALEQLIAAVYDLRFALE